MTNLEAFQEKSQKDFLEYFNIPYPYVRPRPEWVETDPDKILSLSDPHEPYGNEKVYRIAEDNHKDAETLIVPGDLGDYYSKSRYRKSRAVSFKDEVRAVFYRMEWMATHWKYVKIMLGNHDDRPQKMIMDMFAGNEELLIMTEMNLNHRLASYFDNIEMVGTQLGNTGINLNHVYQHGDIIFTHGELSRAQKTAVLDYISTYLHRWKGTLGLKPYKVIAQAHNHSDLKTTMGGEYWFQLPTCSDPYSIGSEYIFSSRMMGRPPAVGFTIFYQHNGVTDFNASQNYVFPVAP